MTMVRSKRLSAFAGSPASSSLTPSSVSLSEAARCGDTPGVIFASSELSSGSGGAVDSCGGDTSGGRAFGAGVLDFKSCSRILPSGGSGLCAGSGGEAGGGGGGGGSRGAGRARSRGGGRALQVVCGGAQP